MFLSKLKAVVGTLMLVAVLVGGGVATGLGQPPDSSKPKKVDPESKQANAKEEATKAMLKRLEGTWRCVSVHLDGKKSEPPAIVQIVLTIKGDKWEARTDDLKETQISTIKLVDLGANPKQIDRIDNDRTWNGIFMLDGDSLIVNFGAVLRPHGFFTEKADGCYSMQFERHHAK